MAGSRRGYQRTRKRGTRRFKRRVIIAAEGTISEPEYFQLLQSIDTTVQVHPLKGKHHSSPPQVLERMRKHLANDPLEEEDEAWLVCDKDSWTDQQLRELYRWSDNKSQHGFALSNPKFEYWLLLHFEDGNGVGSAAGVDRRLREHLPNFDKHISARHFTPERIAQATNRARRRDQPPTSDWPRAIGSTVYRLIGAIRRDT
ncbi:MAG: RloB domain-containing protein [Planctomycetota bacterium]|nr:MAG: RloB domain-containing protein [Planctomycetota bacterium]